MSVCRPLAKLSPLCDVRKVLFTLQGRFAKPCSQDGQPTHQNEVQPWWTSSFGMFPIVHALRGSFFSQYMSAGLPVAANLANVAQDQEVKMQLLEQRCRQLTAENRRLYDKVATAGHDRRLLRELNHRLSIEIHKTRKDAERFDAKQLTNRSTTSKGNVQQQEAQATIDDLQNLKRTHRDIQTVVSSLQDCNKGHRATQTVGISSQTCETRHQETQTVVDTTHNGTKAETNPSASDSLPGSASEFSICRCGNSWGCAKHRVYSGPLMLAHRELACSIARGPPGLQVPPASTETNCARLKLVTRTEPQRQVWQKRKFRAQRQFLRNERSPGLSRTATCQASSL